MTIAIIAASIAAWVACAFANKALYARVFGCKPGPEADLIVLLGPIGAFMLGLCAGLQGYINLTAYLGKRLSGAGNLTLLAVAVLVPWLGASVANYVWYKRVLDVEPGGMDCDLIVAIGPIGSFMLGLFATVGLGEKIWRTALGSRA